MTSAVPMTDRMGSMTLAYSVGPRSGVASTKVVCAGPVSSGR